MQLTGRATPYNFRLKEAEADWSDENLRRRSHMESNAEKGINQIQISKSKQTKSDVDQNQGYDH